MLSTSAKERSKFVFHDFEDEAEVLTYQFIIFGHFVSDRSERTASRHTEALLQLDLRKEPPLQILPAGDFVLDGRVAALDRLQMNLEDFVNQAFLALEIVIELAFPRPRSLDNLVRAGCASPLFVEEVGGGPDDAKSRLCSPRKSRFHGSPYLYRNVHS